MKEKAGPSTYHIALLLTEKEYVKILHINKLLCTFQYYFFASTKEAVVTVSSGTFWAQALLTNEIIQSD